MNISRFLGVWFPIWLGPDKADVAAAHSLRSPASVSPNQISLVGLFIIAGSDCEWCLANGFSIQICWLDATESQQGLSVLWRRRLRSGVNKREMTLLKYAFAARLFLHFGSICIDFKGVGMERGRRGRQWGGEEWWLGKKKKNTKCDKIVNLCVHRFKHPKRTIPSFSFQGWQDRGGAWLTTCEINKEKATKQSAARRGCVTVRWAHAHQWGCAVLNDSYGYDNNYKS